MFLKAESLLNQLRLIKDKNDKVEEETGGLFNIFSILNMERLEVQTHSALIYELLNPKGSHSQGNTYLKIFIDQVLEIENFNFDDIKVHREKSINSLGRVDLLIENKESLIIIEIKIDARDQEDQLKRYSEYGEQSGKDYKIYYLTLFGSEASDYSTGNRDIEYKCISFEVDILNWIKKCIGAEKTPMMPVIRETLVQYSRLIEKITNQLDGGLTMEIKDLLLKENNLSIAEQILKVIPYCKAELEYKFWKNLHSKYIKRIENVGVEYMNYGFFINEKDDIQEILEARKKKNGDIYFEYKIGNIDGNGLYLCMGSSGYDERIYIILTLSTEEDYIPFKEYDESLLRVIEELGFDRSSKFKHLYFNYDLNFHTESIFKLQDEATFDLAVNSIGDELLDIINRIINNRDLIELGVEMNK